MAGVEIQAGAQARTPAALEVVTVTPRNDSYVPTYDVAVSVNGCTSFVQTSSFYVVPLNHSARLFANTDCGVADITWTVSGNGHCVDFFTLMGNFQGQHFTSASRVSGSVGTRPFVGEGNLSFLWRINGLP
jgi:hypothetical protein